MVAILIDGLGLMQATSWPNWELALVDLLQPTGSCHTVRTRRKVSLDMQPSLASKATIWRCGQYSLMSNQEDIDNYKDRWNALNSLVSSILENLPPQITWLG